MGSDYEKLQEILDNYKAELPIADQGLSFETSGQNNCPPKVARAREFIIAHLFDPGLTVIWMKHECKINSKIFSSVFYKHLKYYPKDYILHHRLRISKKLLLKVDTSITFIAHSVGFNSLSSFAKPLKEKKVLSHLNGKKKVIEMG